MIRMIFLIVYRLAWGLFLPLLLIYLFKRGWHDALYSENLLERFAIYNRPMPQDAIWVHGVSLGETRSVLALIRMILDRGDNVIITNFTPAGRREAQRHFAAEIGSGQLAVIWVPLDMMWSYHRFFRACQPKIGLTLEVEVWPAMISAAKRAGCPLYMCNGQYGTKPLKRDSRGLRIRQRVMRGLTGVFVKSNLQASRFVEVGVQNVHVTGELRFDQPIPEHQLDAAIQLRTDQMGELDNIIAIASGIEGEEDLFVKLIKDVRERALNDGTRAPLFVYVPRAPERFGNVAEKLKQAGLNTALRSDALDKDLAAKQEALDSSTAVLLGDSMGEMYFYLNLADRVIVGGGYCEVGAHNIIEPLSLRKPVLVGPHVWTIEYPFVEAQAAGIVEIVEHGAALAQKVVEPIEDFGSRIDLFLEEHSGASQRTLDAIDAVLAARAGV